MDRYNAYLNVPYKLVLFEAYDDKKPRSVIYHTNVVLAILDKHAVCCTESIKSLQERKKVIKELTEGGRALIDLSYEEMKEMCGNMIQLKNG